MPCRLPDGLPVLMLLACLCIAGSAYQHPVCGLFALPTRQTAAPLRSIPAGTMAMNKIDLGVPDRPTAIPLRTQERAA
jgi:hypothetical protein